VVQANEVSESVMNATKIFLQGKEYTSQTELVMAFHQTVGGQRARINLNG